MCSDNRSSTFPVHQTLHFKALGFGCLYTACTYGMPATGLHLKSTGTIEGQKKFPAYTYTLGKILHTKSQGHKGYRAKILFELRRLGLALACIYEAAPINPSPRSCTLVPGYHLLHSEISRRAPAAGELSSLVCKVLPSLGQATITIGRQFVLPYTTAPQHTRLEEP